MTMAQTKSELDEAREKAKRIAELKAELAALQVKPKRPKYDDKWVRDLTPKGKSYFQPDPEMPKHGVRVHPSGPSSFIIIMRDAHRKQRWVKIGNTTEMAIEEAREKARGIIKRLKAGEEPFAPTPTKPDSVAEVIEMYFKRHVEKKGFRTAGEKKRIVDTHVLPVWRDRPFTAIGRGDIARLCDAVEDGHGAWVADTVLVELSAIARWYAKRHDTYQPPFVAGMKRKSGEDRKRSRVLSDDEIRRVWAGAGDAGTYGGLVKILLMTAQRREKVTTMKWRDLAPDGTWTIATEKREKNNPGKLILPKAALAIIDTLPRFAGNPHVFAASRGVGPISHFAQAKADFDKASGVSDWTLHDLRRTARSLMPRAGIRSDIAERVLGHAKKGVEDVYDKYDYGPEKAEALGRLTALIEIILAGKPTEDRADLQARIDARVEPPGKVVSLPPRRGVLTSNAGREQQNDPRTRPARGG
jgi:integrase